MRKKRPESMLPAVQNQTQTIGLKLGRPSINIAEGGKP